MLATGHAKLRYLVATRGPTLRRVAVLLVLVGLLGGGWTMAHPPTETVTERTHRSVVATESSTSAVVQGDHAFYDAGETLTDEPVYLLEVAPDAVVTVTTRAPPGVDVEQRLELVYEASSKSGGVFRERRRVLASTTDSVGSPDGTVESSATLHVAEIAETLATMREEVGDAGDVAVYLAVETRYRDDGHTGTLADRGRLEITRDSYQMPDLSASGVYGPTTTRERPVADMVVAASVPGVGPVVVPHLTVAFVVLALVAGAAGVVVHLTAGDLDADRERARIHRRRYEEWISPGELPAAPADWTPVVTLDSLEALVDVAIDSDTRVIHDRSQGCYAVLTAGATYAFVPSRSLSSSFFESTTASAPSNGR